MFVWIQFGKGMVGCGHMRLFNRESSRIAFFLRRRALLRLIAYAESHAVWKNAGEKPACRFFSPLTSLFVKPIYYETTEKPARGFFL
ncbi:hypothetical protein SDC9_20368 [bioreactor metagenome]|uniref:Uncharacterized protein n=1 Tax=bioreactor metagenome TaxID=1076179 RepID=A0A644U6J2_9ZZZZ